MNVDNPKAVGYVAPFSNEEDARKTGLKNGIRQLTNEQIERTLNYPGQMAVDDGNFVNGCYCPLAVGAGLDRLCWAKPPTDAAVAAMLHLMGFRVNNTRGIKGDFFRDNRLEDYRTAAQEVLAERGVLLFQGIDGLYEARKFAHVDDLGGAVTDDVKVVIVQGCHPDDQTRFPTRSEAQMFVVTALLRAGIDQYTICSVLVNPDWKISEGVLQQVQPVKYVLRLFERAEQAVGA